MKSLPVYGDEAGKTANFDGVWCTRVYINFNGVLRRSVIGMQR